MQALCRSAVTLALSFSVTVALAQAQPKPDARRGAASQTSAAAPETAKAASWFKARQVADKVWCIDDHGSDNMYLVVGETKALLVDTGLGVARLADFVKTLTDLAVIVVTTHGHPDHAGGNNQFPSVYAHPLDFDSIRAFGTKESRQRTTGRMVTGAATTDMLSVDEAVAMPQAELVPVRGGYVFDLGGRKLEVIEQPGHTPGEIVLLDAANRIVFAGDNNNVLVWLFLPTCRPLEVYLESLKKLKQRDGEFETILPGHGAPLPKDFLADQIACVESILDGTCKDEPYQSFAGNARVCRHKTASVAFDPANLRVKE
jgi:hydroxyacylglutathione hydrolase